MSSAITVRDLHKSYNGVEALRGVDLEVEEGEVFGLLGPNGAGKTTTVEILDEPTTGFDPAARRSAWDMIRSLRSLGKTILLTTHYLDEAEQLADRVAVIRAGKIVGLGTPSELIGDTGKVEIRF